MNRLHIVAAAVLACTALSVAARDPQTFSQRSFISAPLPHVGSLTPPPKEWAMFPEDPPAQLPQKGGQAPATGQNANGNSNGGSQQMGGIVSAPNLRSQPQKELPLLWMLLTGALSVGALAACGGLILQKNAPDMADGGELPVVSEELEVQA